MRSISKCLVPAVSAVAVLLLAGCQNGNNKEIPKTSAQKETVIDTTEEDTMEAFYERMWRWKALAWRHEPSEKRQVKPCRLYAKNKKAPRISRSFFFRCVSEGN